MEPWEKAAWDIINQAAYGSMVEKLEEEAVSVSKANTIYLPELPPCTEVGCNELARYKAKTLHRVWATLCPRHFKTLTTGKLGIGVAQYLAVGERKGTKHRENE